MKRLLEIVMCSCLTMGLLTSGTAEKELKSGHKWDSYEEIQHDTTGFIRFIEVDSFNLTIFPPSSGVQFYKDGIVFLFPSKNEEKILPEHISFGTFEAYIAIPEDTALGKRTIFSPSYSFTYPCEAMTFSTDFNTLYFTKIPKKKDKEKIYLAKYNSKRRTKSGWVSEKLPQDFCSDNSTYTHPTLSADEREMIFASDKEGSLGGMDLFITRKEGDKWSAPQNLGSLINTTGNEFFPFLDSENNLFFSSDGLPGYGGFDVFTCKFNGDNWDNPINLSQRINSENDDIAFTINKTDGKTGFYTKRQKYDKEKMQLFRVTLNEGLTDRNNYSISYVYNGEPVAKRILTATSNETDTVPEFDISLKVPEIDIQTSIVMSELMKQEFEIPEPPPVIIANIPEEIPVTKPLPPTIPTETKAATIESVIPTPVENRDVVIYRIQFLSSTKPQEKDQIVVNGKSYKIYEYFYLGAYRYTIGELSSLDAAKELESTCRQSGLSQAFVAAFKNNTRSLDPKLFK